MRLLPLAAAALLVLAAGCAPARAPWSAAGVAQDKADADWADCKRVAERAYGPAVRDADTGRSSQTNPLEEADRRAAAKSMRQSIDGCMRAKGYFPAR